MEIKKALVLTVGVGDQTNIEESLLTPLTKSIKKGQWQKVVLLPSIETGKVANQVMESNPDIPISICSLSKRDLENNADECFKHFDNVLQGLKDDSYSITADFTRGTKAMSAALVLAAVRHDVRQLRYVYGSRDQRGTVEAGTEKIGEVNTTYATGRALVDKGRELIAKGGYSASLTILPRLDSQFAETLLHKELHNEVNGLRKLAEFFAAWDRFDYKKASDCVSGLESVVKEFDADGKLSNITNWADTKSWIRRLKSFKTANSSKDKADLLKYIIVDLFANCERRVYHQQFEDAMVRMFSILEMTGQMYLYTCNIDSAHVTPKILKEKGISIGLINRIFFKDAKNPNSSRNVSYRNVVEILKELGHDKVDDLSSFDKNLTGKRNESILIHGHEAKAFKTAKEFRMQLKKLEELICKDEPELRNEFNHARFLKIPEF